MKNYSIIGLLIIFISFTACTKENDSNKKENNSTNKEHISTKIIWTTTDSAYQSISSYKE